MRAKPLFATALLISLLAGGWSVAQPPMPPPGPPPGGEVLPTPGSTLLIDPNSAYQGPPWLRRTAPGGDGPIGQEVAVYTGVSLPVGGGVLSGQMTVGWMVELRGRSIAFINDLGTAAWVIHYGLGYIHDWQSSNAPVFTLFGLPVRVEELHRFHVGFGGGRDWFLYDGSVSGQPGTGIRFGMDVGGRWGGMRANIRTTFPGPGTNFLRRYDVTGAVYLGAHLDYQVNMVSWTWFGGFRTEWAYQFSDILPGFNSDLQDVNLLLTTGIRY